LQQTQVPDEELALDFPLAVFYPTETAETMLAVGPYRLSVAPDAPIGPGSFPLVLISHGTGGTPWVYRTLAQYLAQQGFVVGLPEHPFNNRHDNRWEGTECNLLARPRHLQLALQHLLQMTPFAAALQPDGVGVIGHSMGGYTALALAGGVPTSFSWENEGGQARELQTVHDPRVKAVVLLAPATPWFMAEGSLRAVQAPVLLLEAEQDVHTTHEHGQIVRSGLAEQQRLTHRVIENAGHFSFLSPFPAAMTNAGFAPSQDPPGFDRARFHEQLFPEIATFLEQALRG